MIAAIAGDIIGSVFEHLPIPSKSFPPILPDELAGIVGQFRSRFPGE